MLLGDVVEPYVRGRVRRGEIRPLTARNVRATLTQFATINPVKVSQLRRRHVVRWLDSTEYLAQSTRRNRLTIIRTFCRSLVDDGFLNADPCRTIRPLKEPRRLPRALSPDQVGRVLAACPDARARLTVLLMVQEGMRRGEVARLEVGDFDMTNRLVRVHGKGGHQRVVHVTDQTRRAVNDYLTERCDIAGPLLRSYQYPQQGLHPDTVSTIVRKAMVDAGVKRAARDGVSPHALRHSCLTDMLLGGAHLRDVQAAAGHAHLTTTELYLPLTVGSLSVAMEGRWYGPAITA